MLISQYLLRLEGRRTVYLGQNVPYNDVLDVARGVEPQYLLTFFVSPVPAKDIEGFLSLLCNDLPNSKVLVSGAPYVLDKVDFPDGISRLLSLEDLEDQIHS